MKKNKLIHLMIASMLVFSGSHVFADSAAMDRVNNQLRHITGVGPVKAVQLSHDLKSVSSEMGSKKGTPQSNLLDNAIKTTDAFAKQPKDKQKRAAMISSLTDLKDAMNPHGKSVTSK